MAKHREPSTSIVGGGPKKILYTLQTVGRIGLLNSAKALKSRNTCKACGLGMGGQKGGMTNELGEFPAVCNKSIQAQSTDIQPPVPQAVFDHRLDDFAELTDGELERLGRLDTPLYKAAGEDRYQPVDWETALDLAANKFRTTSPSRSFFYSSGRSSNEAGFLLQLFARLYGTNNINNCSYYCHQATGVGLGNVLGSGTATVSLGDLQHSDCIFVIGANPASNHPRFVHQLKACRDRGGEVVVINPARETGLVRFAVPKSAGSLLSGGSWIASEYVQPRVGSDLSLLNGLAKAVLEMAGENRHFIENHTEGFAELRSHLQAVGWQDVERETGVEKAQLDRVAEKLTGARNVVFAWGMGITHHRQGVESVEAIANLALLCGQVGKPGAGLLPLRGHSNVQGIGTVGVKPQLAAPVLKALQQRTGAVLPEETGLDTLACLRAAAEGKIDAALLLGGNLLAGSPRRQWSAAALANIPFKLYLTTTLNRGHVDGLGAGEVLVLPVQARDEEGQPTTQESMFNFVRLSDGGIRRLVHARGEVATLSGLARRVLPDAPLDFAELASHRAIRQLIADTVPGMQPLAEIDEHGREFTIAGRVRHTPQFATDSGRARFQVAHYREPGSAEYPFMLASVRSEGQFNSIIYEESDSYRGVNSRQVVFMNRDDMAELKLTDGRPVTVRSDCGEMPNLTPVAYDLPRGCVLAYYPEANALVGSDRDPRSQTPAFKSQPVAIIPAD